MSIKKEYIMHYIDVILVIIGGASLFAMSYFAFHLATLLKPQGEKRDFYSFLIPFLWFRSFYWYQKLEAREDKLKMKAWKCFFISRNIFLITLLSLIISNFIKRVAPTT